MALSIGSILYVLLLLINSLAILNEERFLAPIGWASIPQDQVYAHGIGQSVSVKAKIINLVSAVRTLLRSKFISYLCHYSILDYTNDIRCYQI
ncbi:Yos1-like-domain-containing protein [Syncephalis fuscata]|nr:Yos1-like-domain-containing protein [Syncephalis fuscata]